MKTDSETRLTPTMNQGDGYWPKRGTAPRTVRMTDSALAKFFRMLSAYLTTIPTISPPNTCVAEPAGLQRRLGLAIRQGDLIK